MGPRAIHTLRYPDTPLQHLNMAPSNPALPNLIVICCITPGRQPRPCRPSCGRSGVRRRPLVGLKSRSEQARCARPASARLRFKYGSLTCSPYRGYCVYDNQKSQNFAFDNYGMFEGAYFYFRPVLNCRGVRAYMLCISLLRVCFYIVV